MNDMSDKRLTLRQKDILYVAMMIVPLLLAMLLKILTTPPSDGITITGARVFFTIPMPIMDMPVSEAQVNAWLILVTIIGACLFLTNGLGNGGWRQHVAEWIVEKLDGLVKSNMESIFSPYAPFVGAILALSACSSLMSLLGVFPPTSDLNVVGGWAILVFVLITKNKLKGGVGYYLKGFLDPIPVMLPMNIISEIATPISMTFRHFGNVLSGTVISVLVGWALQSASAALLGWMPGVLGEIPFLRIGIPGILSAYFDVFSGCIQAFIFAMLTMLYVSGAYPGDEIAKRPPKERKTVEAQ